MKPSNSIESDNNLWLPPLTQKNQKKVAVLERSKSSTSQEELWIPPITPKNQKRIQSSGKNKIRDTTYPPRTRSPLDRRSAGGGFLRLPRGISGLLGFRGKTLWDWLPFLLLLVVAASVFLVLARFAMQQTVVQDQLAQQTTVQDQLAQQIIVQDRLMQQLTDQQKSSTHEEILQQQAMIKQIATPEASVIAQLNSLVDQEHEQSLTNYLDSISSLILSSSTPLLLSRPGSVERMLAQTRTMDILNSFSADPLRKAVVIQFLHNVGLIQVNAGAGAMSGPIISLASANLSGVTLTGAILSSSSFHGTTLTRAKLTGANLANADLSGANLEGADLSGANLKGANMSGANTKDAKLKGATF